MKCPFCLRLAICDGQNVYHCVNCSLEIEVLESVSFVPLLPGTES